MNKPNIAILGLVVILLMQAMPATAKKVGYVKDGVFYDADNKFSMLAPQDWSDKIASKSNNPLRLTLMQKSSPVPQSYQGGYEDYAQIPTIKVLVDTCTSSLDDFVKRLTDPEFKSEQKKFFLSHLKLYAKTPDVLRKSELTIGDATAHVYDLRQAYTVQVSQQGSDRANEVNDFISGSALFCLRQGKIFVIQLVTEYQTSAGYEKMWKDILGSLKFDVTIE